MTFLWVRSGATLHAPEQFIFRMKGVLMKISLKSALIALFILTVVVAGFAANNSATVTVTSPLQVNGAKLQPGSYNVTWTANGNKADVVFKSGKTEVKATAKLEDSKTRYPNTAVMRTADGQVKQLWIGGKTTTLVFADTDSSRNSGE